MKGFNPGEPLGFLRSYVLRLVKKNSNILEERIPDVFGLSPDSENMDKYLEIIIKKD